MKHFITLLALVASVRAGAQTEAFGKFKIADQEIIYQKVFTQDSITTAKLKSISKRCPMWPTYSPMPMEFSLM